MSLAKQILQAVMNSDDGRQALADILEEASNFADLWVTNMENADPEGTDVDGNDHDAYVEACDLLADMADDLENAAVTS